MGPKQGASVSLVSGLPSCSALTSVSLSLSHLVLVTHRVAETDAHNPTLAMNKDQIWHELADVQIGYVTDSEKIKLTLFLFVRRNS